MLVVKVGGKLLKDGISDGVINDLKVISSAEKVILVHGGGPLVTQVAEKLGRPQKFVTSPEGFRSRYVDKEMAEIYAMVMSKVNKDIVVSLLRKSIPALGISGLDGGLLRAERKDKIIAVEGNRKFVLYGGYTGKLYEVKSELLEVLIRLTGCLLVVAPVALGRNWEVLDVDGDRVAAYLAAAVKADRLIFLTDVEGVYADGELVSTIMKDDVKRKLQMLEGGMKMKLFAALEALNMGVKEVIISSGKISSPISNAIAHKAGTVVR